VKRILLIDAVDWDSTYPLDEPLRSVPSWFGKSLNPSLGVELIPAHARSNLPDASQLAGFSGVIMSGSPRDAWDNDPLNQKLCDFVFQLKKLKIPFLGVCFGHQILARAFQGNVGKHPEGLQLGNVEVTVTPEGTDEPLFQNLESTDSFICGHADTVLELPPNSQLLARSQRTKCQAFKIEESLLGVQFHPEFTPEILRYLWTKRVPAWEHKVDFDINTTLNQLKSCPNSTGIFKNFITHYAK
jgi:GMP synthase (glutamine-hydrolysing)